MNMGGWENGGPGNPGLVAPVRVHFRGRVCSIVIAAVLKFIYVEVDVYKCIQCHGGQKRALHATDLEFLYLIWVPGTELGFSEKTERTLSP